MKERLKNVLIEGLILDYDAAEIVSSNILDWVHSDIRALTCTVYILGKIVIAKFDGSDNLSISVTDGTNNVAGGAIIMPDANSYIVKFPLNSSCE